LRRIIVIFSHTNSLWMKKKEKAVHMRFSSRRHDFADGILSLFMVRFLFLSLYTNNILSLSSFANKKFDNMHAASFFFLYIYYNWTHSHFFHKLAIKSRARVSDTVLYFFFRFKFLIFYFFFSLYNFRFFLFFFLHFFSFLITFFLFLFIALISFSIFFSFVIYFKKNTEL
jgi:uncharacterized membrane protein